MSSQAWVGALKRMVPEVELAVQAPQEEDEQRPDQ